MRIIPGLLYRENSLNFYERNQGNILRCGWHLKLEEFFIFCLRLIEIFNYILQFETTISAQSSKNVCTTGSLTLISVFIDKPEIIVPNFQNIQIDILFTKYNETGV